MTARSETRKPTLVALGAAAALNVVIALLVVKQAYLDRAVESAASAVPDFTAFWAAARMALEGDAPLAWNWEAHKAVEIAGLGFDFAGWMPWSYPPVFQVMVVPFGAVSLPVGMILWIAVTLGLYLWVAWRILPGALSLLICLATGPTMMALINGQSGLLIGALTGLALLHHRTRPWQSGLALGALAIKPQLALALPVVLAAGSRWRMFAAAALSVIALIALSALLLGPETWSAFVGAATRSTDVFAGGELDPKFKMYASLYGWLRLAGLDLFPALGLHAALAVAGLALAVQVWRKAGVDPAVQAAMACYATVVVTPRILTYDLSILVIGALFQLRAARETGLKPGEGAVLAAALMSLTVSVFLAPGPAPLAAPLMLAMCWHARGRMTSVNHGALPAS